MKRRIGFIAALTAIFIIIGLLSACGNNNDVVDMTTQTPAAVATPTPAPTPTPTEVIVEEIELPFPLLDPETEGVITIMTWNSTLIFLEDIGRREQDPDDLINTHMGNQFMAVARVFNQLFPNIQINFNGQQFINTDGMPFHQNRENFTQLSGLPIDIFWSNDIPGEVSRGQVADLSLFSDDPRYQMLNPALMNMMNIEGRQFGLPWAATPEGLWINRALAELNNIDVPPPNWNFNQYLDFVSHYSPGEWFGSWNINLNVFVPSLTRDFHYMLRNRGPNDPFVNVNSQATRNILSSIMRMVPFSGEGNNQMGNVSQEFMDAGGWSWSNGTGLVGHGGSWLLGSSWTMPGRIATNQNPGDFDFFPRPSTDYIGQHVGLEMDIIAMRNFAMDDGNPALSLEEYNQKRMVWEFLIFAVTDPRSLEARINHMFYLADGETMRSTKDHSLPLVVGEEFDRQMARIFETEGFSMLADRNMYPGFHMTLDLFREGHIVGTQFRDLPGTHEFEGNLRSIVWEWNNMQNGNALGGIRITDPGWLDAVFAHLPEFNEVFNQRWAERMEQLSEDIRRFYPELAVRPEL